jgi:hypothetical protein
LKSGNNEEVDEMTVPIIENTMLGFEFPIIIGANNITA